MARLAQWTRGSARGLLAMAALLAATAPAGACSHRTADWTDWERCCCVWRLALAVGAFALLWGFCFHYLLLRVYLRPYRPDRPWPRRAVWLAVSWFVLLYSVALVAIFGMVSDEWRTPTGTLFGGVPFLRAFWPVLAVLLGGVVAFLLIRWLTRRAGTAPA